MNADPEQRHAPERRAGPRAEPDGALIEDLFAEVRGTLVALTGQRSADVKRDLRRLADAVEEQRRAGDDKGVTALTDQHAAATPDDAARVRSDAGVFRAIAAVALGWTLWVGIGARAPLLFVATAAAAATCWAIGARREAG